MNATTVTLYRRDYDEATWQTLLHTIHTNCRQNADFCIVTEEYVEVDSSNL